MNYENQNFQDLLMINCSFRIFKKSSSPQFNFPEKLQFWKLDLGLDLGFFKLAEGNFIQQRKLSKSRNPRSRPRFWLPIQFWVETKRSKSNKKVVTRVDLLFQWPLSTHQTRISGKKCRKPDEKRWKMSYFSSKSILFTINRRHLHCGNRGHNCNNLLTA